MKNECFSARDILWGRIKHYEKSSLRSHYRFRCALTSVPTPFGFLLLICDGFVVTRLSTNGSSFDKGKSEKKEVKGGVVVILTIYENESLTQASRSRVQRTIATHSTAIFTHRKTGSKKGGEFVSCTLTPEETGDIDMSQSKRIITI